MVYLYDHGKAYQRASKNPEVICIEDHLIESPAQRRVLMSKLISGL